MTYDVLAVNIKTRLVRLIASGKDSPKAEAIVEMAVMRRGLDEEFFTQVLAGMYRDGDSWKGISSKREEFDPISKPGI